ncbi:ribonuclease H-like domain-containing protein [Tanacetum coccineum]|uniref:Ribonuclease H-like domain-containing protein n=1 Tax=Tanacetum coccineum TaxID=301880 RepID=A0ABQ4XZE0_9ASTR
MSILAQATWFRLPTLSYKGKGKDSTGDVPGGRPPNRPRYEPGGREIGRYGSSFDERPPIVVILTRHVFMSQHILGLYLVIDEHKIDVEDDNKPWLHRCFRTCNLVPKKGESGYCLLIKCLLALKINDIVLTASSTDLLHRIISSLYKEFDMTDLEALNYFLGISVTRDSIGMFLSQKKYALELLKRAQMANCNPTRMSVDTESKLGSDGDPISDPTLYRSLAGGLQYLTFTRPDISYAVQQVCLHMHDPREPYLAALKRVLRYVRGTLDFWLQLYASITGSLVAYTDADRAGCPTTRRSTSGYCVFLGDNLLSWSAKRQHILSRSSAEAEYMGVANVVAETVWLRNLLRELHTSLLSVTLVYCNVSAIYMTTNLVQHQRTKHIEIDIHFFRDMVARGQVRVLHVPSRYQYADIFTKRQNTLKRINQ